MTSDSESRALVASSSRRILGFIIKALAIAIPAVDRKTNKLENRTYCHIRRARI
jgi:hypothetical protein